jgi:hypothetical protein
VKFASTYEKLKEKAEAKERGEQASSGWMPRPSPLQMALQNKNCTPLRTKNPTFAPLASPTPSRNRAPECFERPATPRQFSSFDNDTQCPASASKRHCSSLSHSPAVFTPQTKKRPLSDDKRHLLAELTEKMQLCLRRLQDDTLDAPRIEKYRTLIKSIKRQMDTVNGCSALQNSPAFLHAPAFSPATPSGGW